MFSKDRFNYPLRRMRAITYDINPILRKTKPILELSNILFFKSIIISIFSARGHWLGFVLTNRKTSSRVIQI